MVKKCDGMLSRFHLIPERNGQTDRQICYISMLTHDKKSCQEVKLDRTRILHCKKNCSTLASSAPRTMIVNNS